MQKTSYCTTLTLPTKCLLEEPGWYTRTPASPARGLPVAPWPAVPGSCWLSLTALVAGQKPRPTAGLHKARRRRGLEECLEEGAACQPTPRRKARACRHAGPEWTTAWGIHVPNRMLRVARDAPFGQYPAFAGPRVDAHAWPGAPHQLEGVRQGDPLVLALLARLYLSFCFFRLSSRPAIANVCPPSLMTSTSGLEQLPPCIRAGEPMNGRLTFLSKMC